MRRFEHGGNIYGARDIALDFSVNTNPFGLPGCVKAALAACVDEFSRYPDPFCRALRGALAVRLGVEESSVLCGNGAADLIFRICASMKPRRTLVLAPTFSEYERSVRTFGGDVYEYPLFETDGFVPGDGLINALDGQTDIVFLCNPNNPTGRLTPPSLIERLAKRCMDLGATLVIDECFIGFSDGETALPLIEAYPNVIILRAFTKLYSMAGLRLGCMFGNEARLGEIARFGAEWSVSVPAQTAGIAALGAEPDWSERTLALIGREREFMSNSLSEIGLTVFRSDANFLLIKSGRPLCAHLLERGILVRDCSNFSGLGEDYIRIGLKTRADNETLVSALNDILKD